MIRMIQSQTAARAKSYFNDSLLKSDYYVNDQELNGSFRGMVAQRIGIEGLVTKDVFHTLCENIHPKTGSSLTPRKTSNRTVGYDINFHCPKSVSVLHALTKDNHIMEAFHRSVLDTMTDIENDAQTRVRKNGKDENRPADGLVYADFIHQTARPVKGQKPDPHLHCHCFVFNVTWDNIEKQFKAGQFRNIKRDMPYYQALFHKRLADQLMKLGYKINPTKAAFEIKGVPENIIDLFSKRTNEIGQLAKDQNITDANALDKLGGRTRAKKDKGWTIPQLKAHWITQIKEMGFSPALQKTILRRRKPIKGFLLHVKNALEYATKHHFERSSVVQERRLLESAIRYAIGSPRLTIDKIRKAFAKDQKIIKSQEPDGVSCTTTEIIKEERAILKHVLESKGAITPHYLTAPPLTLDGDQAEAVAHVLTTRDRVSIIMGRAGTGKTTLMKETVAKINAAGKAVTVVAPTAQASRGVLREEGFERAETVAKLLSDKSLQDNLRNQVLWVDEAGLLGTKDMLGLMTLAKAQNAQLILSGDSRQHSSVARGDALRFLHEVGGVTPVGVNKIHRQKSEQYRLAIEALSSGDAVNAYKMLDEMGAIVEVDPDNSTEALVDTYLKTVKRKKSVLVVSPTHHQCGVVTDAVRKALKNTGQISRTDQTFSQLINLNLTEAEKTEAKSYRRGTMIRPKRKVSTLRTGQLYTISEIYKDRLVVLDNDLIPHEMPLAESERLEVYQKRDIALADGDKIQVTRNGKDTKNKQINNGQDLVITGFHKDGSIIAETAHAKTKYLLARDFGHIDHAYCVTSHASQGKTVDVVLISQPSTTFNASDLKQFYVSASRGRQDLKIFTDDVEGLLEHTSFLKTRKSALELLRFQNQAKDLCGSGKEYEGAVRGNSLTEFELNHVFIILLVILFQLLRR